MKDREKKSRRPLNLDGVPVLSDWKFSPSIRKPTVHILVPKSMAGITIVTVPTSLREEIEEAIHPQRCDPIFKNLEDLKNSNGKKPKIHIMIPGSEDGAEHSKISVINLPEYITLMIANVKTGEGHGF